MMSFHRLLGIVRTEVADGASVVELPFKNDLLNTIGIIHGGAIMSLIDATIGAAASSVTPPGKQVVTAELNVSFLAPCSTSVIGRGKIIKTGRTLIIGEAHLYDENDNLVAAGRGTFAVIPQSGDSVGGE